MDVRSIMAVLGLGLPPEEALLAAFRQGTRSTAALVAYGLLALSWLILFARAQRLAGFGAAIAGLPELQRAQILRQADPRFAGQGSSSLEYLRRRQQKTWFVALAALVAAATVVAVSTLRSLP